MLDVFLGFWGDWFFKCGILGNLVDVGFALTLRLLFAVQRCDDDGSAM